MFSALVQNLKKEIQVIFVSKKGLFHALVGIILQKGCRIGEGIYRSNKGIKAEL